MSRMIQQRGHPDKAPQPGRIVAPARGVCTCDNRAHGAEFTNLTLFGDHTWLTARWITGAKRRRHDQFGAPTAKMRRHTAPGSIRFSTRWLDRALADFELTLQLNPNFSLARCYCGRWRKACENSAAGNSAEYARGASRRFTMASPLRPIGREKLILRPLRLHARRSISVICTL